jgi:menaquinone-dependent protoporphyrinogen oxidase
MSTLIAYMTRHGCAEKAAELLEGKMNDDVAIINLKKDSKPDLSKFDTIIIGGSIHAGQIQNRIKKFCQKNLNTLLKKRLGLFLCCMEEGETAQKQFEDAYSEELRNHAAAKGLFGGEFDLNRMNFFERAIVKKAANISENVSKLNEAAIYQFASKFS